MSFIGNVIWWNVGMSFNGMSFVGLSFDVMLKCHSVDCSWGLSVGIGLLLVYGQ